MNLNVQISEVEALPPGTNPLDGMIDSHSMGCHLNGDPTWMFVYEHHRHNDDFVVVHVPTGTRKRVKLSPKHAATAEATRQAERKGGYGTKLSFGDVGQKRYRFVVNIPSPQPTYANLDMWVLRLERLGALDIREETYKPSAKGSGKTPDTWKEISFMADDKALDRIFDSGHFSGLEVVH